MSAEEKFAALLDRLATEALLQRGEHLFLRKQEGHHSDTQPRVPAGSSDGGQFTTGGGGGGGGPTIVQTEPVKPSAAPGKVSKRYTGPQGEFRSGRTVDGFKTGVEVNNGSREEIKAVTQRWEQANPNKTLEAARAASNEMQDRVVAVGRQIEKDIPGARFIDPGVKDREDRILEKLAQRGNDPTRLHDLSRATFVVDTPDKVQPVLDALGKHFGVAAEPWKTTDVLYTDKAFNLRDPNGLIGEMQIMPPEMNAAKHRGHPLYVEWRELTPKATTEGGLRLTRSQYARMKYLEQQQKNIYGEAGQKLSPAWKQAMSIPDWTGAPPRGTVTVLRSLVLDNLNRPESLGRQRR